MEGTIKEKFGSEVYIFETPRAPLVSGKVDKVTRSVASKKEQSGPSTTVSSKKGNAAVIVETVEDVSGSNYSIYVFILTELMKLRFLLFQIFSKRRVLLKSILKSVGYFSENTFLSFQKLN